MNFVKRPSIPYQQPYRDDTVRLPPERLSCTVDEWHHKLRDLVPHIVIENIQLINAWAERVELEFTPQGDRHVFTLGFDSFVLLDPVLPDPFDTTTLTYKPTEPRPLTAGDIRLLQRQLAETLQPYVMKPFVTKTVTDAATSTCIMWILHRNRIPGG